MTLLPDTEPDALVLPLMAEQLAVTRKQFEHVVRVATVTQAREQQGDEALTPERIEIEHVPIGVRRAGPWRTRGRASTAASILQSNSRPAFGPKQESTSWVFLIQSSAA